MATENTYRFDGMKNDWDTTSRIVLEGPPTDPTSYVDLKGTAKLTDEKAKALRASGVKLTKLSDDEEKKLEDSQKKESSDASSKKGAGQTAASDVQGPTADDKI